MKLEAIRQEARFRLQDVDGQSYLWKDEWLDAAINEAEREACLCARLIEDNSSDVTSIAVTPAATRYALSPLIIDVISVEFASSPGCEIAGWTLTESQIVLDRAPLVDDTLLMKVIRLPLVDMRDGDSPEIRSHHHMGLLDWVAYRAYMVQDGESFNPVKAEEYRRAFERSFGRRPDAGVQRKHRNKSGRVVRMASF